MKGNTTKVRVRPLEKQHNFYRDRQSPKEQGSKDTLESPMLVQERSSNVF